MAPSRADAPRSGRPEAVPQPQPEDLDEQSAEMSYTLDEAIDGLFIDRADFSRIVERLRAKKNLIRKARPAWERPSSPVAWLTP